MKSVLLVLLMGCGDDIAPPDASVRHTCRALLECDGITYGDDVSLCGTKAEIDSWKGAWLANCFLIADGQCWKYDCLVGCEVAMPSAKCYDEETNIDAGVDAR